MAMDWHQPVSGRARLARAFAATLASCLVLLFLVSPVTAQRIRRPTADADPDRDVEQVFNVPDRELLRYLSEARDFLAEGRFTDAFERIDRVLKAPEDSFYQPQRTALVHRSVKAEAQRLLSGMSDEGYRQYALKFGAEARSRFDKAIAEGDFDGIAEVAKRLFHTQAGAEATLLLGLHHLDRGRSLAAALTLERLRDHSKHAAELEPALSLGIATGWLHSGMKVKAEQALRGLKQRAGDKPILLAGRATALFGDPTRAVQWLAERVGAPRTAAGADDDQWTMFGGNAARTGAGGGGAPLLNMEWMMPVLELKNLEEVIQRMRAYAAEQDVVTLPGLQPLAVGDTVFVRNWQRLVAVDLKTGKRIWQAALRDEDEKLPETLAKSPADALLGQPFQLAYALGQRVWDDATYGTLSSDGKYVYSIEDLPLSRSAMPRRTIVIGGRTTEGVRQFNRLSAFEINNSEGKLRWTLGGPRDKFGGWDQAETFFLGPPLPLMGQLYVLADIKGEGSITLLAIDPAQKGKVLWRQPLATVESTILEDPSRRLAGASPSYADGVLVCPTGVGAVVAIDLATRSLLWGYRYSRINQPQSRGMVVLRSNAPTAHSGDRWHTGPAVIAGGKVLLTPIDSDQIHCLDLHDGSLAWKAPRGESLYLAGVHDDNVLLVGRRSMRALSLANGETAWVSASFPEGALPSGHGFLADGKYCLPLSSAEVLTIDARNGKLLGVARSRKGVVPGNLICHRGMVISQTDQGVAAFRQFELAKAQSRERLAANPKDADALVLRAEVLMDENKPDEALGCLWQAYESQRHPRAKALLRDALLEDLRSRFAAHAAKADEIEKLIDEPEQKAAFYRLMAEGLRRQGDCVKAFDYYERLLTSCKNEPPLEAVSAVHSVRRDRWLQAQLTGMLRSLADTQVRRQLAGRIESYLAAARESGKIDELRLALDCFGDQPQAAELRVALAEKLAAEGRVLEAELMFWDRVTAADPAVAGPATAELAKLMRQVGREEDAIACYRLLDSRFAKVVCQNGKTGRQIVAELPAEGLIAKQLAARAHWPQGAVEVKESSPRSSQSMSYGRFPVRLVQGRRPFMEDALLLYDQQQRLLIAKDGGGDDLWRVQLKDSQNMYMYRATMDATARGHLLLTTAGTRLVAVDTAAKDGARLLWQEDLSSSNMDIAAMRSGAANGMVGSYNPNRAAPRFGQPNHGRFVYYQRLRVLTVADAVTGAKLWTSTVAPLGCEVWGNDELVFALPADATEAFVFRALDGEPLGKRKVPRSGLGSGEMYFGDGTRSIPKYMPLASATLGIFGARLLVWDIVTDKADAHAERVAGTPVGRRLRFYDVGTERDVWPEKKFSNGAVAAILDDEAAGVCEQNGKFTLIALGDGKTLVDLKLPIESSLSGLQQIGLRREGDGYLLIVHAPSPQPLRRPRHIQPLQGVYSQPITRGFVFAFDRDGKPAWPEPTLIEYQYLHPAQPSRSPVLVFACQEYLPNAGGGARQRVSIQCVDKRTGKKLDPIEFDGHTDLFDVVADATQKSVELRLSTKTYTLQFSESKPGEKAPKAAPADSPKRGSTLEGVLNGIFRATGNQILPRDVIESLDLEDLLPLDDR